MDTQGRELAEHRLRVLEARVAELERRLGMVPMAAERPAPVEPPPLVERGTQTTLPPAMPGAGDQLSPSVPERPTRAWRVQQPASASADVVAHDPVRTLEQTIGQKIALWVGAGVLLLGVLFFLQFAWKEGWIRPSPMARFWMAAGFGCVLLWIGVRQSQRAMRLFGAVLCGLGTAVMMSACYAAASAWGGRVLTPVQALLGVAVASAIAAAAALNQRMLASLLAAQLGALAAPFVLGPDFFVPGVLSGYVLTIGVVTALVVVSRQPGWLIALWVAGVGGWAHLLLSANGAIAAGAASALSGIVLATLCWLNRRDDHSTDSSAAWRASLPLGAVAIIAGGAAVCIAPLSASLAVVLVSLLWLASAAMALWQPRWLLVTALAVVAAWVVAWLRLPQHHDAFTAIVMGWFLLFAAQATVHSRDRRGTNPDPSAPSVLLLLATAPGWMRLALGSNDLLNTAFAFGANDPVLAMLTAGFVASLAGCALLGRTQVFQQIAAGMAAMLALTIPPMLLDRFSLAVAWLVLAGIAGGGAALTRWRLLHVAAIALWSLCVVRLGMFDYRDAVLVKPLVSIGSLTITTIAAYGIVLAFGGLALAWLTASWRPSLPEDDGVAEPFEAGHVLPYLHPTPLRRARRTINAIAATLTAVSTLVAWAALARGMGTAGPSWTIAALLWVAVLLVVAPIERRTGAHAVGATVLLLILVKWAVIDAVAPVALRFSKMSPADTMPVINLAALAGAVGLVLAALADRARRDASSDLSWGAVLVAIALVWLSVEAIRAVDALGPIERVAVVKHATLSVLWALAGLVGVACGFVFRNAGLRYSALAVLAGTLLKIVVIDMAEVQAVWRVLTFMLVGALLISVSFLYQRQAAVEAAQHAAREA